MYMQNLNNTGVGGASPSNQQSGSSQDQTSQSWQAPLPPQAAQAPQANPIPRNNPSYGGQVQGGYNAAPPNYARGAQASPQSPAAGQQNPYGSPQAYQQKAQKKTPGLGKTFFVSFVGAALAVVLGLFGFGIWNSFSGDSEPSSDGGASTILGSSQNSIIHAGDTDASLAEAVAEKALPSVVSIDVYATPSSYSFFGFEEDSAGSLEEASLGSGVILSEDGYVITNYHVVEGAELLEAHVGDTTYQADIVGTDPSSDIAVIKLIDAENLTPIEIGSSQDLNIGQWVMTIGSPFGLEQSVATGIVSAVSRSQIMQTETGSTVYADLVQTDAAINPGNSGGALVDANGKLIGINTLITSYSGNYSGVGFAIAGDYAIQIAQQIIDGNVPSHAQLGVSLTTVNDALAERYGLPTNAGAYISQVAEGGAAELAGIEEGDIITKLDDTIVTSASDLMIAVRKQSPHDTVSIELNRAGENMVLEVTLGSD